jgi:hypothetical protein
MPGPSCWEQDALGQSAGFQGWVWLARSTPVGTKPQQLPQPQLEFLVEVVEPLQKLSALPMHTLSAWPKALQASQTIAASLHPMDPGARGSDTS